jgi:predicted RecA/RadA family phage recombinase
MADIALKSTNASTQTGNNNATVDVEQSIEQMTLKAAADMNECTPVYVDSNGKFAAGDASVVGTADIYGITLRKVKAGEAVTAIAKGVLNGLDLSAIAFGASVYLSDTTGRIADAAGTVSVKLGTVVPSPVTPRGTTALKLIRVNR